MDKLPTDTDEWNSLNEGKQKEILTNLYLETGDSDGVARALKGCLPREQIRELMRNAGLNRNWLNRQRQPLYVPKILYLDIETAPVTGAVWGLWNNNLGLKQIYTDWYMICWAGMWEHEREVFGDSLHLTKRKKRKGLKWYKDDLAIVQSLWDKLEEADVVIGHNSKKFDIAKWQSRSIELGLLPPTPFRQIDTLEASKKHKFTSNKLDWLVSRFVGRNKLNTDMDLWNRCYDGDTSKYQEYDGLDAFEYMYKYNGVDIELLREVYLYLRPWMNSHPNLAVIVGDTTPRCPACTSDQLDDGGLYPTNASLFPAHRCRACGHISRGRFSLLSREQRRSLLISTAG